VRLLVISRKINPKNLEDATVHDFKIIYYSYLVAYHVHEGNYLDVAKCYQKIWETLHARPELQTQLPKTIEFGFNIEYAVVL
jgi:26S proteasome regulatory subunit N5